MKLISLAVLLFGLCNAVHANEAPMSIPGTITVNLQKAKQLYDDGAIFIDVRKPESWSQGHIAGSLNLSVNDVEFAVLYVSEDLDRLAPVVFYNSSPLDVDGALAAKVASDWGYKNVFYFRDGFYAWMAADLPVDLKMTLGLYEEDRLAAR